jgi:hypothetical protein
MLTTLTLAAVLAATAEAAPQERKPIASSTPLPPANVHLAPAGAIALPGRGLAIAWSPDGTAIAAGGHFKDPATGQRYDTRCAGLPTGAVCSSAIVAAGSWSGPSILRATSGMPT